jgi:hypothetical protein
MNRHMIQPHFEEFKKFQKNSTKKFLIKIPQKNPSGFFREKNFVIIKNIQNEEFIIKPDDIKGKPFIFDNTIINILK